MLEDILLLMTDKMDQSIQALKLELGRMKAGKASSTLLDTIEVDDYDGSRKPLSHIATITTPNARMIQIFPWEGDKIQAIEKEILKSNLGLTPQNDGKVIQIPIPSMTEEQRNKLIKHIKILAEKNKVALRHFRHQANEKLKKLENSKEISLDLVRKALEQVQKRTGEKIAMIDQLIKIKEKEILKV